ncbi:MAG: dihydrolipoamide acetyltransferase family protein [Ktedonobacteraceae bacterium]
MGSATTTKVIMPKLGLTMEEGTVVNWLKQHGEMVYEGDVLGIIETEKLTHDIEAQGSGQFQIMAPEGTTVPAGETIGYIVPTTEDQNHVSTSPAPPLLAQNNEVVPKDMTLTMPQRKREISPVALRMAQHLNVDLDTIAGSGPRGRIHKADILLALEQHQSQRPFPHVHEGLEHVTNSTAATSEPAATSSSPNAPPQTTSSSSVKVPYEVQTVSPMRRRIVENMQESLQSTAQLTLMMEANVTHMLSMRAHLQQESQRLDDLHITLTDIFIKVVAQALLQHRLLNATLVKNELRLYREIHIGVATTLEHGLLVPVIHQADKKSIAEISGELKKLTEQARNGTISPDDLAGSTFTITNLGTLGVEYFTPILYRQQSGILGVGRIAEHHLNGNITTEKQSTLGLSLTFDHRVVDGFPAAQFLNHVKYLLEHPWSLLLSAH